MEKDFYYTVRKSSVCEIKIKGSRFIGHVFKAETRESAETHLEQIRKQHHSATHNCFAYRVGSGDSSIFRSSDDGEPSGTAGRPILEALDSKELTNAVCIVTRYYGGTKLGTGGLIRAYGGCAAEALDAAGFEKRIIFHRVSVQFPYELTGSVMGVISQTECKVNETKYGSDTEMILDVRISLIDQFIKRVNDACSGKAAVSRMEE